MVQQYKLQKPVKAGAMRKPSPRVTMTVECPRLMRDAMNAMKPKLEKALASALKKAI